MYKRNYKTCKNKFNYQKKKNNKAKAKKLNRIATKLFRMMSEATNPVDVNAWKRDNYMSQLKDEKKYLKTANTSNKWTLFNFLIGKTLHLFGLKDDEVLKYVKSLNQSQALKIVILLMKFQKTMDLTILNPLLDMKIPGLTSANFLPMGRQKILNFLNAHIRLHI